MIKRMEDFKMNEKLQVFDTKMQKSVASLDEDFICHSPRTQSLIKKIANTET